MLSVNGIGRHTFYIGYVEANIEFIIVENMIQSYCRRVNGYGRHTFYIGYVEANIEFIIVENMILSYSLQHQCKLSTKNSK